ncbi:TPA: glycosyltransferase family 9 protein, partial [Mannheimia haemolytica]|nr:glycosyltransferase family 9 protein [Mannheimia haemolytica]
KARLVIGKAILDSKNTDLILSEIPNKILFLRHDGKIGDYVVSSFVFREIKKQSPQTQIGVVCSQKNRYLFENNPYIDKLYLVKTKSIPDYIRGGKQLAKEQYDVVIDPTVTLRNRDLLFLRTISAKHYVGYQKQKYRLFDLNVEDRKQHFSEIYQDALALIGFENIETQYDVP